MSTISESISRIRNGLKAVKEEAFITDRYIYSVIMKYGHALIERENKLDSIFKFNNIFKEIPYLELIEVPVIDNCYISIDNGCTIKKSKEKLPEIATLRGGSIIKYVTTIDHNIQLKRTTPDRYYRMKNLSSFKYNKEKYYWIIDNYLYVPDIEWDAVAISAYFKGDISDFLCSSTDDDGNCVVAQNSDLPIPEHLLAEAEQMAKQEIYPMLQIPVDTSNDNQNLLR